jgi:hypothetical protein
MNVHMITYIQRYGAHSCVKRWKIMQEVHACAFSHRAAGFEKVSSMRVYARTHISDVGTYLI